MYTLRYLAQAKDDLIHIKHYIARESGSAEIAMQFTSRLREQCRKLSRHAGRIGQARPELGVNIRSFPYGNYLIFFTYCEKELRVISIIEGHRDIKTLFKK